MSIWKILVCKRSAPPITSSGSVVCQRPTREVYQKNKKVKDHGLFHNPIGAFRRKADYIYEDSNNPKIINKTTRILDKLKAHELIKKVPKKNRY